MALTRIVQAVFIYPDQAIPLYDSQEVGEADLKHVTLPFGAYGFVFNEVIEGEAQLEDGSTVQICQRSYLSRPFIIGRSFTVADLEILQPPGYEELLSFLESEEDYEGVIFTVLGIWIPLECDHIVIAISKLKPLDISAFMN